MTMISIFLAVILLVGMGGPFFASYHYRMIWLAAFLSFGIYFFPFAAVYEKNHAAARCSLIGKRDRRHAAPKRPFQHFRLCGCCSYGHFRHHHIVFQKRPPIFFTGSGRPIFRIILSRSKNPVAMKKNGLRNFKGKKSAERTKKAAIHPIIRESPLLLIKAVIFCS